MRMLGAGDRASQGGLDEKQSGDDLLEDVRRRCTALCRQTGGS
jgi:hypothetical protein